MRTASGITAAAAVALLLAACGGAPERGGGGGAELFERPFARPIVDASGARVGTVSGTPGDKGVTIRVEVARMSPGQHGMHLHEAGRCDPPDFSTSGAHWNAARRSHGHDNPQGPHDGDWGNLTVGEDGTAATDRMIPRYHGKFPDAGLSLVIHAQPDDERTDPSGNSGARVACGVVVRPQ